MPNVKRRSILAALNTAKLLDELEARLFLFAGDTRQEPGRKPNFSQRIYGRPFVIADDFVRSREGWGREIYTS